MMWRANCDLAGCGRPGGSHGSPTDPDSHGETMTVELVEISHVREADMGLLQRFYDGCLVPAFPNEDERDSLEDIQESLRKQGGGYGANNYHVIIACSGGNPVGGSIFDYLAEPNAGVIEFLLVNAAERRTGLGTQLVKRTESMMAADAKRAGQELAWVAAELDDPFRTPPSTSGMDPFSRVAVWDRWGYRMLDFPYTQPALSAEKSAVDTLLMVAKALSPQLRNSIPTDEVFGLLREYFRWSMGVPEPTSDPTFQAMWAYLHGTGTSVPVITLSDYVGADAVDAPVRICDVDGPDDPQLRAAIDVYTEVFTDPAIAIPPDKFREAFSADGIARKLGCNYHLWAIYRRGAARCEGMASFLSMPSAGFGGYLALIAPLRGAGHLHYLMSRIERQIIEDGTSARGWYVECAGPRERDIFVRPSIGFHQLDVPYTQPSHSGMDTLATGQPLHLLYKPFGRVYRPPAIPVADFLTAMSEILTLVYRIDDPKSNDTYVRLQQRLSDHEFVPIAITTEAG